MTVTAAFENVSRQSINAMIAYSDQLLARLSDPESPSLGQAFLTSLKATGCIEQAPSTDQPQSSPASYRSFDPNLEDSFINQITYLTEGRNLADFVNSRVHEAFHAMAWRNSAVLHASPFNRKTVIVPCPEDFARIAELVEADAYAKQGWLASRLAGTLPEIRNATKRDPIPAARFEEIRGAASDLPGALQAAARESGGRWFSSSVACFNDHYHGYAVDCMARQLEFFVNEKPVFCKLSEQDFASLGDSFGPNLFQGTGYLQNLASFSEANRVKIDSLNARWGITDREKLPSFADVRQAFGYSSDRKFIDMSSTPIVQTPLAVPAARTALAQAALAQAALA